MREYTVFLVVKLNLMVREHEKCIFKRSSDLFSAESRGDNMVTTFFRINKYLLCENCDVNNYRWLINLYLNGNLYELIRVRNINVLLEAKI